MRSLEQGRRLAKAGPVRISGLFLAGTLTTYRKYLQRVLGGDWLAFPRRLFNDTASVVMGERAIALPADSDLLGTEANFGAFVEVEEIENVQLWPVQFWQRSVHPTYSTTKIGHLLLPVNCPQSIFPQVKYF